MRSHIKAAVVGGVSGGLVVALALVVLASGPWSAWGPAPVKAAAPSGGPTHEEMHRMMDAVHGEGTSQRMHEATGPDAEKMMDECAAMMEDMQDMMSGTGPGMMGGQNGNSRRDMMRRMMAQ